MNARCELFIHVVTDTFKRHTQVTETYKDKIHRMEQNIHGTRQEQEWWKMRRSLKTKDGSEKQWK